MNEYPAKYTDEPVKRKTRKSAFLRKLEAMQKAEKESRAPVVELKDRKRKAKCQQ